MGAFNPSLSTTSRLMADRFSLPPTTHAGRLRAEGSWFRDELQLTELAITNFPMGIVYNFTAESGVLGLGFPNYVSESAEHGLTWALVDQGLAVTEAFSVWLAGWFDHIATGSLLFGAVDSNKYTGKLKSVDMVYRDMAYQGPRIRLSCVKASSESGNDIMMGYEDEPLPVALKLGTSFSMFPQMLAEAIWRVVGAQYIEACSCPAVPCQLSEGYTTFNYGFAGGNGPQITMHLWSMVIEQEVQDLQVNNTDGEPLCAFSILNGSEPNNYSLGEDFLRNAYAVFDLYNNKVALAQARTDSDALYNSNVVQFAGHGAPIPSAWSVSEKSMVIPTASPTSTVLSSITTTYGAASDLVQALVTDLPDLIHTRYVNGNPNVQTYGFNKASDIGVALAATLVAVVTVAVVYMIYYRQMKLRLGLKGLQSANTTKSPPQPSGINPSAPEREPEPQQIMHVATNTSAIGNAAPKIGLAELMASSADLSIQKGDDGEPKSPTVLAEMKFKDHISDEKVLGTWAALWRTQSGGHATGSGLNFDSDSGLHLPP
ncbi:putative aspartic-type endopeptidase opsB [Cytospora mali]|uniref:Aspartic-type endopeptidase opsB n=1 Tax=Cytospora mali TaxID=578113 RepID=A0A194UPW3_CYTMA|nr:putative aspartic-type endopeptidase opsB [Valsa mali var. pyri (nom. inval.)]